MPKPRRKKIGRPPIKEYCVYCVEISNWEMPYHFSVNKNQKAIDGPFWEHVDLKISGKFIHPEKLADKSVKLDILGDRRLIPFVEQPEKYNFEPNSVGSLTVRGEQREFIGSLPFDILPNICLLLQSERIKFLVLSGPPLYRGHSDIDATDFEKKYVPEDWM